MYNTNERWFLFYQISEISLQLAILFIFFLLQILVLGYFLVSYTMCYWLLLLSFISGHLLSVLGNSVFF